MAMISLEKVSYSYGDSFRLADIDLEVEKGALLGIIGPNGSGKSTLLKLMAGYLVPQAGLVKLEGRPLGAMPRKAVAQKLAVVTQGAHSDFDFTVEEMVSLGRLPFLSRWQSERPGDARAVDLALERAGLDQFRHRPYKGLSGGESQRVLIARALAQEPEILLLDEPTTYLDLAYQQEIFTLLSRLNEDGMTVAAVLHDVNMAALYCKDLVALSRGEIFAKGSPETVITRENIRAIYGSTVAVSPHPTRGRPQVTVLP